MTAHAVAISVDSPLVTKLLPGVLRVIAGSVDAISFLGPGGLFAPHITRYLHRASCVARGDTFGPGVCCGARLAVTSAFACANVFVDAELCHRNSSVD
jgi:uncharacterized membrane protein YoaK (UPF0700 family)